MNYVSFIQKAEDAENRDDRARAAMWWNYAAQEACRNGNRRDIGTEYFRREDAAKERDLRQVAR